MIKTIAAWAALGMAQAILLEALGVPTPARIGVDIVYALVAAPMLFRQIMAAMQRREQR